MFHTSLWAWLRLRSRHWTASFPSSQQLSRPWPRLLRLGTWLSAFGIGRLAFPAVDGHLAPGPASLGWHQARAQCLRHQTAGFPALDAESTAISPGPFSDGRRREATLRRRGFDFSRQPLHFGPGFGFCGKTVKVVLASGPGCLSRHEQGRSQGFRIPADNFKLPNELARRGVCDSVGKSPAWRGLDVGFRNGPSGGRTDW